MQLQFAVDFPYQSYLVNQNLAAYESLAARRQTLGLG